MAIWNLRHTIAANYPLITIQFQSDRNRLSAIRVTLSSTQINYGETKRHD